MRKGFPLVLLAFAAGALLAQTPATQTAPDPAGKPAESPAMTSPEMKAFDAANGIKDPAAKVEALAKFLKENPSGLMAEDAVSAMGIAASSAWPDDPGKFVKLGDQLLGSMAGTARAQAARQFAASLLQLEKAQSDAERFARIGVDGFTYDDFKASRPEYYEALTRLGVFVTEADRVWLNQQLTEESIRRQFAAARIRQVETLGLVYVKLGKAVEARLALDEVTKSDPYSPESARGLAALAAKAGNGADQLRWMAAAFLADPTKVAHEKVEALYKPLHNNSPDGLEPYLDAEYERQFPKPAHMERYHGPTKRTVLAELLTGSDCSPCLGMDLAFDALMERYPKADVAFLLYHQNRPAPDPMTNPSSMARFAYFAPEGVPTVAIDGKPETGGGGYGDAAAFAARYGDLIDKALGTEARATIELKASRDGRSIPVSVKIGGIDPGATHLKLHIVIAEKTIRYSGGSGIRFHPMVVRSVIRLAVDDRAASIAQSFNLDKIATELKEYHDAFEKHDDKHNPDGTFRWPDRLEHVDADRLVVVAFLEDDTTKAVLQAASVDLSPGAGGHAE
jgi:thiol-disulfide isomerase/thioredoxin